MISFSLPLLLAFIAAAGILTLTPGMDTAMVLRACAAGGKRPAFYTATGIGLGCIMWGAAVALGLGVLLKASSQAYDVVKYVGAAYLFWIGLKLLLNLKHDLPMGGEVVVRKAGILAFRRGFLTNLLNPKIGVFYVTFLPQFIPTQANVAADSFVLALIHVGLTMLWFTLLITAAAPLVRFLRQPRMISALDRVAGTVFILFGIKLAFSKA